jgi:Glycoside hydrolase family 44
MRSRVLLALVLAFAATACPKSDAQPSGGPSGGPGTRKEEALALTETIFEAGLKNGWQDWGWATREVATGGPARFNFSSYGGWILYKGNLQGAPFGGLVIKYKAPKSFLDFLEVRVDSNAQNVYPRVNVGPQHRRDLPDGWTEAFIPYKELNPENLPFEKVVLRAYKSVGTDWVLLEKVGFTKGTAAAAVGSAVVASRDVQMFVDCRAKMTPINPMIYGIAFDPRQDTTHIHKWELGPTARRWGGNPASRYNWELGNAWNTASDWYFENVNYTGDASYSYTKFFKDNEAHHAATVLTVPMIGWVAKDITSVSFPKAQHADQQSFDGYRPEAGNGKTKDGKEIPSGPPTRTSIAATPEFIGRWIEAIRKLDAQTGGRSVAQYILDNEPALWNSTHRDVHPDPLTYDELLERTIQYGTAIRKADPGATIAGPAEWGWPAYSFSAKDAAAGFRVKPDRLAHGDVPLLAYYLQKLKEHEQKTGTRILDVVDLHLYPQADRVGGENGGVDAATAALRIRSTRALWDPSYVDESWIKEPVRLIPRMKEWIAQNYPGRGISIGEWNFGAERHISGGLAVAEALGRFGQGGVTSAFYWTYPPPSTPAFYAFRAYRNFDGKGGRFLDQSVATTAVTGTSLFASKDDKHFVLVALNLTQDAALRAKIDLASCGKVASRRAYTYSGGSTGFKEGAEVKKEDLVITETLQPYSITVIDLRLADGS